MGHACQQVPQLVVLTRESTQRPYATPLPTPSRLSLQTEASLAQGLARPTGVYRLPAAGKRLHQAEQRGELAICYIGEIRCSRRALVPYAWQLRGQPPVGLPAECRSAGGYSVLGFWQPADPHQTGCQAFHSILSPSSFTAKLFVPAVDKWVATLDQPTVLVLENASVHRAGCVQTKQRQWAAQRLTLFFLPPYSPELNLIEILWRFCKHH